MEKNEILRTYGTSYKEMTKTLLSEASLCDLIDKNFRIGIKPNLMSCIPADFGATTHTEVVEGIVEYLKENGFENMSIIEGSWVGDKTEEAFEICGYNELSRKYGVKLIDTQKEKSYAITKNGYTVNVCECMKDVDFLINVPVVKGHCQTKVTCSLKNMKGLIPNSEKRRFHSLGLHEPIAMLNLCLKQDFIVVDHICGDLDNEGGGNPYHSDCVMVARDPVLLDSYCAKLLGYETSEVPYIDMSAKLGIGSNDLNLLKMRTIGGDGIERDEKLPVTHKLLKLKDMAEDVDTCSACYESLMEALETLQKEGLLEKLSEKISGKICIGQGYKGKEGLYGIGNCTFKFLHSIKGCPPKPSDIIDEMRKWL